MPIFVPNSKGGQGSYPMYKPATLGKIEAPLGLTTMASMMGSSSDASKSKNTGPENMIVTGTTGERLSFAQSKAQIDNELNQTFYEIEKGIKSSGGFKRFMSSEEGKRLDRKVKFLSMSSNEIDQYLPTMDLNKRLLEEKRKMMSEKDVATDTRIALKNVGGRFVPYTVNGFMGKASDVFNALENQPASVDASGRFVTKNYDMYSGKMNGAFNDDYIKFKNLLGHTSSEGIQGTETALWDVFLKTGSLSTNRNQVQAMSNTLFGKLSTEGKADISEDFYAKLYDAAYNGASNEIEDLANMKFKDGSNLRSEIDNLKQSVINGTIDKNINPNIDKLIELYAINRIRKSEQEITYSDQSMELNKLSDPTTGANGSKGGEFPGTTTEETELSAVNEIRGANETVNILQYTGTDKDGIANYKNIPTSVKVWDISNVASQYNQRLFGPDNKYDIGVGKSVLKWGARFPNGVPMTPEEAAKGDAHVINYTGRATRLPANTVNGVLSNEYDETKFSYESDPNKKPFEQKLIGFPGEVFVEVEVAVDRRAVMYPVAGTKGNGSVQLENQRWGSKVVEDINPTFNSRREQQLKPFDVTETYKNDKDRVKSYQKVYKMFIPVRWLSTANELNSTPNATNTAIIKAMIEQGTENPYDKYKTPDNAIK